MKKIILVNGPARSGKDTVGRFIAEATGAVRTKFAYPLKCGTHAMFHAMAGNFGLQAPTYLRQAATHSSKNDAYYEDEKSAPMDFLCGLTPRQGYIAVSEILMKVVFGRDVFGKLAAKAVREDPHELFVITDSGFKEEAQVLVDEFGADNVLVIRLGRDGCAFDRTADPDAWRALLADHFASGLPAIELLKQVSDSRSYIDLPDCTTFPIQNNASEACLQNSVCLALQSFNIPATF